uniref:Centromere protein Q n=1 Tax=Spermophilus dauricus TaxID=99837 RepID=A0A8C9ULN0_SPEDA
MPGKANASKKKSQQLKRSSKRKIDNEELQLSKKQVRNTGKRNKNHLKNLSSEEQIKHTNLKQIKIASNKRKTWQLLSNSTREHLQTMIESVIIAILSNKIKEKEQIQCHLNYLKIRLLQLCETMKVPPRKLKYLTNVSNLLKMEKAQETANEEGLALLQEEIDKMVETTESMTENIHRLKNKIQIVAHEVEEEEEKVKQVIKEILMLIPNQNALLKDLDVLHSSSQMKNLSMFIEEAYKKLDAS